MTITKRLVVDLADIQALRIVCQTCQAVLSVKLTETVRVPADCPNCGAEWDKDASGGRTRPVAGLVAALKAPPSAAFVVQLEFPAE
jgi:predicted RNA-binding Zn-ribbon protein involved in translation (DUF1610 family)